MQFFDITNLEKNSQNLKSKSIVQLPQSPKKKHQINYLDMTNFKFDWIRLDEKEVEVMKEESPNIYKFSLQEQFSWFQNQHTHITYPQQIEHGNFIESLMKHQIDEQKRHDLLCWMDHVMGNCKYASIETYFLAISLLDKFLQQTTLKLSNSDMLVIGVSCLSLASKYKDRPCLSSQELIQLTCDKMDELRLVEWQFTILNTLQHQVEIPNYFKIFDYIMRDLEYRYYKYISSDVVQNSLVSRKFKAIYKCGLNLLKFVSQYYDTTIFHQSSISYGTIFYTIKRMELLQYSIPKDLINVLKEIQLDQAIINTEIVLKHIYRLCQNGMSSKQQKYFKD
ncbi:unnamed protein product (macronuclear) [Paramecium tetraurelia]|uniref:Cyclin-like domain-containing protein n=1 Tax=Paramecium tetraurelia TaxID=5888 RepID=A0EAQ7_PARTE|nr:uncharacterized protein GSPATT00025108001 [Paramecium tetraurelia]CAK92374.1 unnamed protein product [Paramecium tetraurelia]|eukprot:XP_001459771.1 hypothetical protein (macronuclear) [Paramecium tetraurelia strain d4-2]